MTSLQTTPDWTETASGESESIFHTEDTVPFRTGSFVFSNPVDLGWSTSEEATECWRRLIRGPHPSTDVRTLDDMSSVDIRRHEFFALVLRSGQIQPAITSATLTANADLRAAMQDLDGAIEEAREEGYPQPSSLALKNAERLLRDLYRLRNCRFEVYPTPDAEIAIVVPGGHGQSLLVLCDSDGGALCSVNLNGEHRRARYTTVTALPDGFVREALDELDEPIQVS